MRRFYAIAAFAALLAAPASGATIVQNGSFEDFPKSIGFYDYLTFEALPTTGSGWNVWRNLPGWSTVYGKGIEVQTDRTLTTIDAADGDYYVELDSHPSRGSNTRIVQTVSLAKAGHYSLSFAYSPRTSDPLTNVIGYSLGTLVSGSIVGPGDLGSAVGKWTTVSRSFFLAGPKSVDLSFWADGTKDTYGGLLDDVAITYVAPVPVPAAGLLLLGALGGLAALKRRRRS